MPFFDLLAQDPDEAKRFSETMVAYHGAEPPAVAAAYDFSSCGVIVDVGGASGNLLAHLLAKHPRPKGVLFDLPQAMTDAPARLQALGVEDRVTIQAGNACEGVPTGRTPVSSRTSSTTGTKIGASRSSATVAPR